MSSASFLSQLPSFERFEETTQFRDYLKVPGDWTVFVADVVNSTRAAEQGHYKEVNLIGASCIISVLNRVGEDSVLYVFGGDGATFVVGPDEAEAVQEALISTAQLAQSEFDLQLRVGRIPLTELHSRGYSLAAAKWQMSPQQSQSLLCGSGVAAADGLAKAKDSPFLVDTTTTTPNANFEGLECRWNPLPSERGQILSLLVSCPLDESQSQSVFAEVVGQVNALYRGEVSPAKESALHLSRNPGRYAAEARIRCRNPWIRPFYLLTTYVLTLLWDWRRNESARKYRREVAEQSDYRKFDGLLRMVIDGTQRQHDELESWLEQERLRGRLDYGTHRSESALLTCLIFQRWNGQHLHLVDGNDGGYTLAAKAMKDRRKSQPELKKTSPA